MPDIQYTKIGDLTAEELNRAILDQTITYNPNNALQAAHNESTAKFSHYELFNADSEFKAAVPSSELASQGKLATNGVDLYKVKYNITNNGKQDSLTGLLAVPVGTSKTVFPMLSWQHGTVMSANEAPSCIMKDDALQRQPSSAVLEGQIRSTETLFNLVRFAGNGYVVAAADYNGNGDSKTPQYYILKEPTNKATSGMLDAAETILSKLGLRTDKLFLNGWSQGSINTLWLANYLQKSAKTRGGSARQVTKQATSSTFSDMAKTLSYWLGTGDQTFNGNPNWGSSCIPLFIKAYESYYRMNGLMKEAIKPQYLKLCESMVSGKFEWDRVGSPPQGQGLAGLPLLPKDVLNEQFITNFKNRRGRFYAKFKLNADVMETALKHPIRFYEGSKDTIIPPKVSRELPTEFYAPYAQGMHVGDDATHRGTFLGSMFGGQSTGSSNMGPNNDIGTWFASQLWT